MLSLFYNTYYIFQNSTKSIRGRKKKGIDRMEEEEKKALESTKGVNYLNIHKS